jgi:hypothetical protein
MTKLPEVQCVYDLCPITLPDPMCVCVCSSVCVCVYDLRSDSPV